ncbi:MAG: hypothetical protein LBM65_01450 [Oscillospiraceae bacterium]|jgi:hypothetical protein|nr:hypothetical protein [Oscillospiraceae bacterium]
MKGILQKINFKNAKRPGRNFILSAIALAQIIFIAATMANAWIETTTSSNIAGSEMDIQGAVFSYGTLDYLGLGDKEGNNKYTSAVVPNFTSKITDLNNYIDEVINYSTANSDKFMLAEASSADGKSFFFPTPGETSPYRAATLDDKNTNYIEIEFDVKANYKTKLWFKGVPTFNISGGGACTAIRLGVEIDQDTSKTTDDVTNRIFTNNPASIVSYSGAPADSSGTSAVNSTTGTPKVNQNLRKFEEFTFNPATGAEDTENHIGRELVTIEGGNTAHITLRIWLEEQDSALAGGLNPYDGKKLDINLQFGSSWSETIDTITVYDRTVLRNSSNNSVHWLGANDADLRFRLPRNTEGDPDDPQENLGKSGQASAARYWVKQTTNNLVKDNTSPTATIGEATAVFKKLLVGLVDNFSLVRTTNPDTPNFQNEFYQQPGADGSPDRGSCTNFYIYADQYGFWGTTTDAGSGKYFTEKQVDVYLTDGAVKNDGDNNLKVISSNNDQWSLQMPDIDGKNGQYNTGNVGLRTVDRFHYYGIIPEFIFNTRVVRGAVATDVSFSTPNSSFYNVWKATDEANRIKEQKVDKVIWLGTIREFGGSVTSDSGWLTALGSSTQQITFKPNNYLLEPSNDNLKMVAFDGGGVGILKQMTKGTTNYTVDLVSSYTYSNRTGNEQSPIEIKTNSDTLSKVGFNRYNSAAQQWDNEPNGRKWVRWTRWEQSTRTPSISYTYTVTSNNTPVGTGTWGNLRKIKVYFTTGIEAYIVKDKSAKWRIRDTGSGSNEVYELSRDDECFGGFTYTFEQDFPNGMTGQVERYTGDNKDSGIQNLWSFTAGDMSSTKNLLKLGSGSSSTSTGWCGWTQYSGILEVKYWFQYGWEANGFNNNKDIDNNVLMMAVDRTSNHDILYDETYHIEDNYYNFKLYNIGGSESLNIDFYRLNPNLPGNTMTGSNRYNWWGTTRPSNKYTYRVKSWSGGDWE